MGTIIILEVTKTGTATPKLIMELHEKMGHQHSIVNFDDIRSTQEYIDQKQGLDIALLISFNGGYGVITEVFNLIFYLEGKYKVPPRRIEPILYVDLDTNILIHERHNYKNVTESLYSKFALHQFDAPGGPIRRVRKALNKTLYLV